MIYSSLVCLSAFSPPFFWVPSSLRNHLNISFRNFYVTVASVGSVFSLTLGGGIADLQH